jgi:predicted DNA-binding transcriptional regulator YafY
VDAKGANSNRSVRPLALYFWGSVWTLGAWCESRNDFRNFRLDRVSTVSESERKFVDEPGKRLEDFIKSMEAQD